jgi:putative transposase
MPRHARLIVPGLPMHVVHRALNRQRCFRSDNDYLLYLTLVRHSARKFGCSVHAYCLMTNHVHLLVTPSSEGSCAGMMHGIAQRYAHYFNASGQRSGTLWEGRFRSCLVESDRYVLACYRYIELNPVRAGIARHPADYSWSSYAGNIGSRADPLLAPHPTFAGLPRGHYWALVRDGLELQRVREIRDATNGGYPLASEAFVSDLSKATGRKVRRGKAGRPRKDEEKESVDVPDLFSAGAAS